MTHNVLLKKNWMVWITDGHISTPDMVEREMVLVSHKSWKAGPSNKTNNSILCKIALVPGFVGVGHLFSFNDPAFVSL